MEYKNRIADQLLRDKLEAMCAVLCNKASDEIAELFSNNSFDASKIVFSDSTVSFSSDNADFFIYTNSEIISLMCEVKS